MKTAFKRVIGPIVGVVLFAAAAWTIWRALREHGVDEIIDAVRGLPPARLLAAGGVAVLCYALLAAYDALGFRYLRRRPPLGRVLLGGFVGYAMSNSVGSSVISGGAARQRLYAPLGLSLVELSALVAFCSLTYWLGFSTLAGLALVIDPPPLPDEVGLPRDTLRLVGAGVWVPLLVWGTWSFIGHKPVHFGGVDFRVPPFRITLAQILIATVELAISGYLFYLIMPPAPGWGYFQILGLFLVAQIAGFLSFIPGGLGVFDTIILLALGPAAGEPQVVAGLLAYRVIYHLIPLALGAAALITHEWHARRRGRRQAVVASSRA
ncbi:MAG: lysylphosphatidylglycerol synthase domain-containing protein [Phycisphaerales bacterium]